MRKGEPRTVARPKSKPEPARRLSRSVCPLACGLDIFGDRWTLLIVRDLLAGRSRFKQLSASPERIATNLLAERLMRLCEHGIAEKIVEPDGPKHAAYRLTEKGEALRPVLASIRDWGLAWQPGTAALIRVSSPPPGRVKARGTKPARH